VKGAIFHQGFNNARPDAAAFYHQVFPRMIASWREAFQDSAMPFGIISLCTDGDPQTLENFSERMMDYGIYVREAQYKTFLDLHQAGDRHVGFASSYDQRHAWYHPQNKIPAGEQGLDKIRDALRLIDLESRVLDAKRVLERDGERYEETAK
jgi:sialate O-acetylesterase